MSEEVPNEQRCRCVSRYQTVEAREYGDPNYPVIPYDRCPRPFNGDDYLCDVCREDDGEKSHPRAEYIRYILPNDGTEKDYDEGEDE